MELYSYPTNYVTYMPHLQLVVYMNEEYLYVNKKLPYEYFCPYPRDIRYIISRYHTPATEKYIEQWNVWENYRE